MHWSALHGATGGSNAEPTEVSARDADLGGAAGFKKTVHRYANPSLTPRVSAPSAFEPGEEDTLDISHPLRVSAAPRQNEA